MDESRIRLVYVIDSLDPSGGAEQSLTAIAPHYVDRRIDLTVVCLKGDQGLEDRIVDSGARAIALRTAATRPARIRQMITLLRHMHPDIVHTTLFESDIAGRIAATAVRIPVVSSLVNDSYGSGHLNDPNISRPRLRAAQCADAMTAQLVRRFHALTNYVAGAMAFRLHVPPHRIDVIPRGRDSVALGECSADRAIRVRKSLGVSTEPVILVAARHEQQKGVDILIDAIPLVRDVVPDVRVLIAGREGNRTVQLKQQVSKLELEPTVTFLGRRQDVADLLCGADVLAMPSRWEGLGSVLLEAMCVGTPIVASDLPAVRESLTHGQTAILIPPEDPVILAKGLLEVLTNHHAALTRATAARQHFTDHFAMPAVADRMRGFYERALRPAARLRDPGIHRGRMPRPCEP
jgi:glycosyltransferase involved in cell wall biosynthesis